MTNMDSRHGKDEKLLVLPYTKGYDINEIDGLFYMLNRDFTGCSIITFSKPIKEDVLGNITVAEVKIEKYHTLDLRHFGGGQLIGIPVRGIMTEYDKSYSVKVEGFVDEDGNMMESQEIEIKTLPKKFPVPGYEEHDKVALEAAREGIVLLKNENQLLPLQKDEVLNIFGKGLWEFRISATGAGKINPRYSVGLIEAIENYSNFTLNPDLKSLYSTYKNEIPSEDTLKNAINHSDTALITVTRGSGENFDNNPAKGEFYLSDEEEALIKAVTGTFSKTIAIINSGYPIDVSWVEKYNIKAVLNCGFVGMLGGQALVEILDGRINPSGKLPDTWSVDYYDIPTSKNFYHAINGNLLLGTESSNFIDTVYEEGIYVGYRYFETFGKAVAYPFGYGLSYTSFNLLVTNFEYEEGKTKLSVVVKNTGAVQGKEVVQVYASEPELKLEKPFKKLVAFAKTKQLNPGESQTLYFEIEEKRLTSYDEESASWIMEEGTYEFYVGNSVRSLQKVGSFELQESKTIEKVENRMCPPVEIRTLSKKDLKGTYPSGEFSGIKQGVDQLEAKAKRPRNKEANPIGVEVPNKLIKYSEVEKNPELLESFVKQLSVEEMARLSVCASHGWGMHQKGEAGRVFLLDKYGMKDYVVADGNSGVNVNKPNIGMPSSAVVCASFNQNLAYEVGRVIAEEAKENDIHMILAPGMNIHRDPLNGRHPEYFSEDPYLAGIMAGHQSKGLEENGVSSCLKHTVANNCESSRKRNQSLMTERTLREIYLKAFEIAMEVHKPDSIMTGYNAVNGVFTAEDEEMIQGVFRGEFGFEGFVMTDWNSYDTADVVESVQAGNSWMTPGSLDDTYVTPIIEGVKEGKIDKARLERNIFYLLRAMLKRTKQGE
jgi:beta-glucosidase